MPLQVDVKVGETIRFTGSGEVKVTMRSKSGRLSRMEIDADESIEIHPPKRITVRSVVSNGVKNVAR